MDDMALLEELIVAGWGDVPRVQIPDNWRELPPPHAWEIRRTHTDQYPETSE